MPQGLFLPDSQLAVQSQARLEGECSTRREYDDLHLHADKVDDPE